MMNNQEQQSNKKQKTEYFYNLIKPEIEETFSEEQKSEIKKLIDRIIPSSAKKVVDVRFTFWFIKRMFAVIAIGVSRRKKERKSNASGFQKFLQFEFKSAIYILEIALVIFALMLIFFFLKILFGFNIVEFLF